MADLRLLLALGLVGCGAPPTKAPPAEAMAPRPVPGVTGFRLLVLGGDGAAGYEVLPVAYGAAALGWRVQIAAPGPSPFWTSGGASIPATLTPGEIRADDFDMIFVPAGAPAAWAPVVRSVLNDVPGAATTGAKPMLIEAGVAAWPDAGVVITGRWIIAAQPGDLPALLHAMNTLAEDRLRVRHKATGGHPP